MKLLRGIVPPGVPNLGPPQAPSVGDGIPNEPLPHAINNSRFSRLRPGQIGSRQDSKSSTHLEEASGQEPFRPGRTLIGVPGPPDLAKSACSLEPEIQYKLVDHLVQQQDALCGLLTLGAQTNEHLVALSKHLTSIEDNIVAAVLRQQLEPQVEYEPKAQNSPFRKVESGPKAHTRPPECDPSGMASAKSSLDVPKPATAEDFVEIEKTGWTEIDFGRGASDATGDDLVQLNAGMKGKTGPKRGPAEELRHCLAFTIPKTNVLLGEQSESLGLGSSAVAGHHHLGPTADEMDCLLEVPQDEKGIRDTKVCGNWHVSSVLDTISLTLVVVNTIFTGIQVNTNMEFLYLGTPKPRWIEWGDLGFTIVFALEFVARLWVMGFRIFFRGEDNAWNIMDAFFVSSSIFDMLVTFADLSFVRAIRMFRVLRAFRALRGMRFVRDLRLMLAAIMSSMASFMWGFGLLFFMMFISAIAVMQSVVVFCETSNASVTAPIFMNYGTVAVSIISLFKAVSGGQDWNDLLTPLLELSAAYTFLYMAYISVVVFGIMNVLTAVFCENASQISHVDKDLVIQDEIQRAQKDLSSVKRFFKYADADGDGKFSIAELETFLHSPERRAMLTLMEIDPAEALGLFEMMDTSSEGQVDLNTFVDGIMRLRGAAKGCDAAKLLFESKRMLIRMTSFMCYTRNSFELLFDALHLDQQPLPLDRFFDKDVLKEKEQDAKRKINQGFAWQLGVQAQYVKGDDSVHLGGHLLSRMDDMAGFVRHISAARASSSEEH